MLRHGGSPHALGGSGFFCTVATSSREQSYPYCCVLDLGHVFKCPATYLSNDKSGTSSSGKQVPLPCSTIVGI